MNPAFREDIRELDALVGFGVMLYRPERYYVGLSLPRLMLGNLGLTGDSRYQFSNSYHLVAGALFPLGVDFQLPVQSGQRAARPADEQLYARD